MEQLLDLTLDAFPLPGTSEDYRQRQLHHWVFKQGVRSFEEMTNLPKEWRQSLAQTYHIHPFKDCQRFVSKDQSVRYLFTLSDDKQTEAVYMPYAGRKTVCLSSMVGCPAGCTFCATGALGFGRNLSQAEILGQLLVIASEERISPLEIRNVVLMGMGEALLNYQNTLNAIRIMLDPRGLDMSPRRITLSTVGLPERIRKLASEKIPLVLAVSLHAPDEETRKQIIPTAQAYPLTEIMASLKTWQLVIKRRISIEYTMLAGINDHIWQAEALAHRLKGLQTHVNLIPFNPWHASGFRSSSNKVIEAFKTSLEEKGISVSVRFSRGRDTGGACGQLTLGAK